MRKKQSFAISMHSLAAAISMAQQATTKWLGHSILGGKNIDQENFIDLYSLLVSDTSDGAFPEMLTVASPDEVEVDAFMAGNHKIIPKKVKKSDIEFSVGAIFEIALKWVNKGDRRQLRFGTKTVQGAWCEKVACYKDVVVMEASNGDFAYMKMGAVSDALNLYAQVMKQHKLLRKVQVGSMPKVTAHFPFVKLNVDTDLDWVLGMDMDPDGKHSHPGYLVKSAKQKNELDMDNAGARVKSETKVRMSTKGISRKPEIIVIDKPFLFWVVRKGCRLPIFAAYVNSDSLVKA